MTEPLQLYVPKPEDGWFYVKMMSDPDTMSYNAPWFPPDGCIPNPEAEWNDLQAGWIGQEPTRFYAFLRRSSDGAFVGDVNYHYNPQRDWWDMGIVIYAPERGKGYGRQGLRLLVGKAFSDGVKRMHNEFETNRGAAYQIHRAVGFREVGRENGLIQLELAQETRKVSFRYKQLILRDYQESDIDSMLFWYTGHHPWMDWDAPWEKLPESVDEEKYRAWALRHIAAEKSDPRWSLQIEVDGVHIGYVGSYRIGEDYENVSDEEAETKVWHRAVGMAILNDAYWNKGYGTMALEGWLLYLLEHGCQELYLQTWSGNGRMIHIAEKLGFTECERCVGFHEWQGRQYDALTFRLDVEAFRAILKKETEDTD